jgi:hypothetical protein
MGAHILELQNQMQANHDFYVEQLQALQQGNEILQQQNQILQQQNQMLQAQKNNNPGVRFIFYLFINYYSISSTTTLERKILVFR